MCRYFTHRPLCRLLGMWFNNSALKNLQVCGWCEETVQALATAVQEKMVSDPKNIHNFSWELLDHQCKFISTLSNIFNPISSSGFITLMFFPWTFTGQGQCLSRDAWWNRDWTQLNHNNWRYIPIWSFAWHITFISPTISVKVTFLCLLVAAVSLRGKLVVYDNDKDHIGWAQSDCTRPQKESRVPPFLSRALRSQLL